MIPDGTEVYEDRLEGYGQTPTESDTIGDRSFLYCHGWDGGSICDGYVLVEDWMLELRLSDSQGATTEEATAYAAAVFTTIADRVGGAGPAREAWVPPVTPDPAGFCSAAAIGCADWRRRHRQRASQTWMAGKVPRRSGAC